MANSVDSKGIVLSFSEDGARTTRPSSIACGGGGAKAVESPRWLLPVPAGALGTGGALGAIGTGIITFFKRRGQNAIDALDAALPGKPAVPADITATLRELDK